MRFKNLMKAFWSHRHVRSFMALVCQRQILGRLPNAQASVIVPAETWQSTSSLRLLDLASAVIPIASKVDHSDIAARMVESPHWLQIWPGEHYKLLSGLVCLLKPDLVIEIGTATGYSALSIKKFLPINSRLVSFDIVPWKEFPNCVLTDSDFSDGSFQQIIADLSSASEFSNYAELLAEADFVFIDAAKDGNQEQIFIDNFSTLKFKKSPVFLFDDIKLLNMIETWQKLKRPKLDVSSIGHWAGSGLVDWNG